MLSLKPFTCMPSVVSDAIQTKVEHSEGSMVFLAIEMDGDSIEISRSRIQMKTFEAKQKVKTEYKLLCERIGKTPEELKTYFTKKRKFCVRDLLRQNTNFATTYLKLIDNEFK